MLMRVNNKLMIIPGSKSSWSTKIHMLGGTALLVLEATEGSKEEGKRSQYHSSRKLLLLGAR